MTSGIARGEVRADVRLEIVRELGQAMLWQRPLVIAPAFIEQIVDEVLIPFVTPRG